MKVLGIETSCDETGVAIYDAAAGLLANRLYSQIPLHARYGGVVPELASRDHIRKLLPLVQETLDEAGIQGKDLDGVAYTAGPGLIGALLVGGTIAEGLALGWGVPAIPVHHMEAHLLAAMLEDRVPEFPFVALLVSGGHSMLVDVASPGQYKVLGQTLDDAAGEAFDKTAKLRLGQFTLLDHVEDRVVFAVLRGDQSEHLFEELLTFECHGFLRGSSCPCAPKTVAS